MDFEMKLFRPEIYYTASVRATDGSAGVDLRASIGGGGFLRLNPGERFKIGTGLAVYIKDPAYAGFVFSRSGLAYKHGLVVANGVGVIDSDYQGEIVVVLKNTSDLPQDIHDGVRIAQLIFMPVVHPFLHIVETFSAPTARGENGFGSTGTD